MTTRLAPADVREIQRYMYRESFYRFFSRAWRIIEPIKPLVENWHLRYLADELQAIVMRIIRGERREHDYIINVPPATTKSSLVTVALPAWVWIVEPAFKIISVSYADVLAHYHAGKTRDIILSDWYQDLFGDIYRLRLDLNKKSEYANNMEGMRYAVGSGGSAIGRHADLILCDDPINPRKAASVTELDAINDWWDTSISTRLTDAAVSVKVIVMQRLATNDLSGYCLKKGDYRHICLPAELTPDVQPAHLAARYTSDGLLDPVRLNRDVLQAMRTSLGTMGYAGQMLQSPVAAGGNMVKQAWFGRFTLTSLQEQAAAERTPLVWNYTIDGAYTDKQANDATAILAYASFAGSLYIRDVAAVRLEMPDLLRFIPEFVTRNGDDQRASRVYIEPAASGLSVAQMLKRTSTLNVIIDTPPRTDQSARLAECLPFIEAGRVYLLQEAAYVKAFTDEVCAFPSHDHDDQVDALTMAIRRATAPGRSRQVWHVPLT
ncbi:MAG: phage terminase large subunit [Ruminococcus flavefaciens]